MSVVYQLLTCVIIQDEKDISHFKLYVFVFFPESAKEWEYYGAFWCSSQYLWMNWHFCKWMFVV